MCDDMQNKQKEKEKRDNLKLILEQELKKGLEVTTQLKNLLVQPQLTIADDDEEQHQQTRSLVESYSTAILNSFDTSLALAKKFVQCSLEMKPSSSSSSSLATLTFGFPPKPRFKIIETPNLTPDGYTWRKYGHKKIRNTQHPREYYRCAYKEDVKCEAIKHVQKITDNPTKYRITYHAKHTCQSLLTNNIKATSGVNILEPNNDKDGNTKFTLSSESKNPTSLIIPQNLNHPSSTSNNNLEFPSSLTTDYPPPNSHAATSIIEEPKLAKDVGFVIYPEPLLSPTMIMNPNYMFGSIMEKAEDYSLMMADNPFYMSDEPFEELQLWNWVGDDVSTIDKGENKK